MQLSCWVTLPSQQEAEPKSTSQPPSVSSTQGRNDFLLLWRVLSASLPHPQDHSSRGPGPPSEPFLGRAHQTPQHTTGASQGAALFCLSCHNHFPSRCNRALGAPRPTSRSVLRPPFPAEPDKGAHALRSSSIQQQTQAEWS